MFQFIRRHQAIGLVFIGIVIVSFVIFFSPNQGGHTGVPRGALGTINGRPIERGEYLSAVKESRLSHMLREGNWPGRGNRAWDEQREVIDRLFLLDQAAQLGVQVTDEVAAARILELPFLRDERTGTFNRAAYDQFLELILREEGITRSDFEQFMRHEVALQHLVQLGGLSGTLVPPQEAESRYREANDQFGARLVVFSATNYLAQVNLDPANVAQYYSNRLAEYRIPERVQVRYVKFAATNFLNEADQLLVSNTNLLQGLDAEYERRGPDSFRDAQGNPLSADAAKAEIREDFRQRLALDAARKKANEFANRLYQRDAKVESLTELAAESGLEALVSMPFDQFRPPADLRVPSTFNRAAFALSVDEPFATPVVGEDGVFVYAFERRVPSEIQPLEIVRERVIESLKRTESRSLAEAAGRQFATSVSNALAQGKSFDETVTEAGLQTVAITNFSRGTTMLPGGLSPRITVSELLRVAEETQVGKPGGFTPAADGGFVLLLESRSPVPDEEVKREAPEFLKQLRQFGRFSAFMEWQRKRLASSDVRMPGGGSGATNQAATAAN